MGAVSIIDIIFILIIISCAIFCTIKGFIDELFGVGCPILSGVLGIFFNKFLSVPLSKYIKQDWLCYTLSFAIIFITVFLILKIIQIIIKKIFDGSIFNSLDRVLGFIFGLLEGVAIVGIILYVINIQPWFLDLKELTSNSFFSRILSPLLFRDLVSTNPV